MKSKQQTSVLLYCAAIAALFLAICSKNSFLYPFNDWVDENCFLTVGKAMMQGQVVYRDIYEQKGPLVYFIFGIGSLFTKDSFLIYYGFEVLAGSMFLFYSYQISRLYIKKWNLYVVPVLAMVLYSSPSFVHGGSVEELCMPLFMVSLYDLLRFLRYKEALGRNRMVLHGVLVGCVLWMKFTMTGFYIGWLLVILYYFVREGQVRKSCEYILYVGMGVMLATIPWVLYFGYHHAIYDWWKVYVVDNIFVYASPMGMREKIGKMLQLILEAFLRNNRYTIFILLGMFLGVHCKLTNPLKDNMVRERRCILILLVFTLFGVYIGGRDYVYYTLIVGIFAVFGILVVFGWIEEYVFVSKRISCVYYVGGAIVWMMFGILFCYHFSSNTQLLAYDKSELPQYKFARIINDTKNPTLLNYGFLDGGFYTASNVVPNCKYFCELNIPLEEMYEAQKNYVRQGVIDYVVTTKAITFVGYQLVGKEQFFFEGIEREYFLYKKAGMSGE